MGGTNITLERETANDEFATIVKIYVASGTTVAEDDLIFDIENSKATQEVRAQKAGVVLHELEVGKPVGFGVPIATIYSDGEWKEQQAAGVAANLALLSTDNPDSRLTVDTPTAQLSEKRPAVPTDPLDRPHFSNAAAALIEQYAIATTDFPSDFITADDVQSRLAASRKALATPLLPTSPPSPTHQASEGQVVTGRKRVEIESLRAGAGETMLSVLGTTIGSIQISRDPQDFLQGRITDLVIYEAARLLKKYPNLNSYYAEGRVTPYKAIHAGLAIDGGGRLVVYGIENADTVGLRTLSDIIADAVARYADNQLTASELSRSTFTVTDLSEANLDFLFPLLPQKQSCILGVTRSDTSGFRIFAGFDHRVTEGREVAIFLEELRERLLSFSSAHSANRASARCSYCDRSASEAAIRNRDKGLLKVVDQHGQEIYCCASCWNGW